MEKFLSIGDITWVHFNNPSIHDIKEIIETYSVHEIIEQDIKDVNTQDKIDVYDECIFLVLHFPKYDKIHGKYLSNEFNIILGKDFIVSVTKYHTNHIDSIRKQYSEDINNKDPNNHFKISPYYILYKIIDVMYDKVLSALNKFNLDLNKIEESVFTNKATHKDLLERLLVKKRNVIFLKHVFVPQTEILQELQKATESFYQGDLDVYFEDLIYKTDKILANINMSTENAESISNIYNTFANIKTNYVVSLLTIRTVIIGIMTMITGLYGMNVPLPGEASFSTFSVIVGIMIFITGTMFIIFKKKRRL